MSWSYSQALVEEYLGQCSTDTEPSVPLNTTPMPDQFYWPDKTTEHSRLSRFGMMCEPLMEILGKELLIAYQADSRARTLAAQAKAKESTEKNQDSGKSKCGSFAKLIRGTQKWRIPQDSLLEDCMLFSQTWPKWGSMQNGECYQAVRPALAMNETESGYWLPTPTAHNAKEGNYPAERTRNTPTLAAVLGGKINPEFTEWMMGWPIGWTDLKPLAMDKFQSWLQQHSKCFQEPEPLDKSKELRTI